MVSEEKDLLIKKTEHAINTLNKSGLPQYIGFLSEEDIDFIGAYLNKRHVSFDSFGGITDSERRYISVYDDYAPELYEYPIAVLKIELSKNSKEQTHRNYLGSILGLGLDRKILGDIIVEGHLAYVAVNCDFVQFLESELIKISNEYCTVTELDDYSQVVRKTDFKEITVSVSSNRLDAIVSELTYLSREKSKELIIKGFVTVNGEEATSPVKEIKPDSKISVRKFGKFIFVAEQGNTKSGRLRLTFKKYM